MARLVMTGVTAASARGATHAANQDAYLTPRRRGLQILAVADGVGGGVGGEVASAVALRAFSESLNRALGAGQTLADAAAAATHRAADEVRTAARGIAADRRTMATTLTALCLHNGQAVVVHVGDSRAYLWRAGSLTRLTEDHSLAAELTRARALDPATAERHGSRRVLTQAVGARGLRPEVRAVDLQPGDGVLLCTDGLHTVVPEARLAGLLASPTVRADEAVRLAVASGAADDATAVAAHLAAPAEQRLTGCAAAAVGLVLAAALALAAAWRQESYLGLAEGRVALIRGFRTEVAGVRLGRAERLFATEVDQLPPLYRELLAQGVPVRDEGHALQILQRIPRRAP